SCVAPGFPPVCGGPDGVCREARHLSFAVRCPSEAGSFGLSASPLHKQNTIIILRPVIHDFLHLQTRRAQLLNHNLLCDTVPAPVARHSFHRIPPRPPPHTCTSPLPHQHPPPPSPASIPSTPPAA